MDCPSEILSMCRICKINVKLINLVLHFPSSIRLKLVLVNDKWMIVKDSNAHVNINVYYGSEKCMVTPKSSLYKFQVFALCGLSSSSLDRNSLLSSINEVLNQK